MTATSVPPGAAPAAGPPPSSGPVLVVVADTADVLRLAPVAARLGDRAELAHVGPTWDGRSVERYLGAVGCRRPGWFVALGERRPADRFGEVTQVLDQIVAHTRPAAAVVHGSSSGAVGAAFACASAGVPLVRLGAGRHLPPTNRLERLARAVDHLADLCVVADDRELMVLLADGLAPERLLRAPGVLGDALAACASLHEQASVPVPAVAAPPAAPIVAALDTAPLAQDHGFVLELLRGLGRAPAPAVLVPGRVVEAELALPPSGSGQLRVATDLDLVDRAALFGRARAAVCDSVEALDELVALGRPVVAVGDAAGAVRPRHRGCRPVHEADGLARALAEVVGDGTAAVPEVPPLPTGGVDAVARAVLDLAHRRPLLPVG